MNNNHLYYNYQKIKFNSFESYYRLISYLLFTYISMIEIKVSAALTFFHIQRIARTVCNFSRLSKFGASTGYFFIFIGTILPWHFDRSNCKRYKLYNKDWERYAPENLLSSYLNDYSCITCRFLYLPWIYLGLFDL